MVTDEASVTNKRERRAYSVAGEKNSKSVLFGSVAVLAIPAVIYLMGSIYWDSYLSDFGIDLAKINLPVYKVMVGATPAVYGLILAALLFWLALRQITRTKSGYEVPVASTVFVLGLVFLACGSTLLNQPISIWLKIAICAFGVAFVILSYLKSTKRDRRVGWRAVLYTIVLVPVVLFVLLELLSEAKATSEARKVRGKTRDKCSFVRFHSRSDTSFHLPDSLVLIASSESHYFVFSRAEPKQDKPTVFAVNKNSVSYMEIVPREKSESAGLKQRDQSGPSDLGPR